jgi:ABC-2 type transport system permease protein
MEVSKMKNYLDMVWIEGRKALRSRMPLWTALGSLFMPLGMGFLIFVARNPVISHKLGLVSAKADLVAYSATDWASYLGLSGMLIAAGGFILFVLSISWVFGREFADGTLKDLLAVPVQRASILLAKFSVVAVWSVMLTGVILAAGLLVGALIGLPGGTFEVIAHGSAVVLVTAGLAIGVVTPFAFFASLGRGYLLPVGLAILILMATNLMAIAGWGDTFPWAVPGLYAQAKTALGPESFASVALTGLAGMAATYLWWKYADQNK